MELDVGQGSSELEIPPQVSQSKPKTSRQMLDEMEAEDKALCAQVAREKGFAIYEDLLEAEFKKFGETLKARLKRHREDGEQMGEDAPKRKAARRHKHSPEPWYRPKRCRCTNHMTPGFCEANLKTPPGSMTGFSAEWDEAQRPKLENLVVDEQEPSKRLSDAELDLVWSYDEPEAYNPRGFPAWAKKDEVTLHLQRQLKRSRPGGRELGVLFLDAMDGIESSSVPGKNLNVTSNHRPPKLPTKWSSNFEIIDDSRSQSLGNINSNVTTQNQPLELPSKPGSKSDAVDSVDMRPMSYIDSSQYQPLELLAKQSSNLDAVGETESLAMSNIRSDIAAQHLLPELPAEQGNNFAAMDGIESRPISDIGAEATAQRQPPKLPLKQGSKEKRGGKGAFKKGGSKGAPGKLPSNATAGAPSVKKAKAKKAKGANPPWLHSLLEQPRQTRSQDRKILYELDAQSQVVPTQLRRSQRNGWS
ncbi:MAG: hypothetical protein Q9188_006240 [Gyalolechia gomerana]